jgi:hypothetical protein
VTGSAQEHERAMVRRAFVPTGGAWRACMCAGGASERSRRSSGVLDSATELAGGPWCVSICAAAGEATITYRGPRSRPRRGGTGQRERSRRSSAARSRRTLVRYVVANGLSTFVVLTLARELVNVDAVRRKLRSSLAYLRCAFAGERFPWAYVLESGRLRGRLHAHLFVPRFDPVLLGQAWPYGWVGLRKLAGKKDRSAAALYVAKDFEDVGAGRHRYEVSPGFAPEVVRARSKTQSEAFRLAVDLLGREPDRQERCELQEARVTVMRLLWDN